MVKTRWNELLIVVNGCSVPSVETYLMLLRTKHQIYMIIFLSDYTFGCLTFANVPYWTLL